ncbi:MAG: hypothetical protein U1E58_11940 [Tabrizicola sp.]
MVSSIIAGSFAGQAQRLLQRDPATAPKMGHTLDGKAAAQAKITKRRDFRHRYDCFSIKKDRDEDALAYADLETLPNR